MSGDPLRLEFEYTDGVCTGATLSGTLDAETARNLGLGAADFLSIDPSALIAAMADAPSPLVLVSGRRT